MSNLFCYIFQDFLVHDTIFIPPSYSYIICDNCGEEIQWRGFMSIMELSEIVGGIESRINMN